MIAGCSPGRISEMRGQLRGLSTSARAALLLTENPDPTLVQAVLEAPGFSSGVSDDIRERMLEIVINRDHPNDLAEIAQVEEALELLDAATGMTLSAAKSVSEFPTEKTFNDFIGEAPAAVTDTSDPLKQLNGLGPTTPDWRKE